MGKAAKIIKKKWYLLCLFFNLSPAASRIKIVKRFSDDESSKKLTGQKRSGRKKKDITSRPTPPAVALETSQHYFSTLSEEEIRGKLCWANFKDPEMVALLRFYIKQKLKEKCPKTHLSKLRTTDCSVFVDFQPKKFQAAAVLALQEDVWSIINHSQRQTSIWSTGPTHCEPYSPLSLKNETHSKKYGSSASGHPEQVSLANDPIIKELEADQKIAPLEFAGYKLILWKILNMRF